MKHSAWVEVPDRRLWPVRIMEQTTMEHGPFETLLDKTNIAAENHTDMLVLRRFLVILFCIVSALSAMLMIVAMVRSVMWGAHTDYVIGCATLCIMSAFVAVVMCGNLAQVKEDGQEL